VFKFRAPIARNQINGRSRARGRLYALLVTPLPNAVNAALYDNLSSNFVRDIAPVAQATFADWAPKKTTGRDRLQAEYRNQRDTCRSGDQSETG
jgi:hypothetical protein